MSKARDVAERFWEKVDKTAGDDACWPFTGAVNERGYGVFHRGEGERRAHRVAWVLTHGPIPGGLLVCHHCDNRRCANPAHLFLGTAHENTDDARRKNRLYRPPRDGRAPRGEHHWAALLTPDAVRRMRDLAAGGLSQAKIARAFGVTRETARAAITRKTWAHVV